MSDDQVFAKCAWRLIPFLVVLFAVSFLDRVNIGFAALTMNSDLGFTPEIYGFGAGIFFFGYFLFEVPSNVILARVGARRWICRIMITWGVISAATALAQGPASFYVLRFLLGVAEAGFSPGIIYYLSLWFPPSVWARYAGRYWLAIPICNVIGAPLSSVILGLDGVLQLHGWQWLFILEAAPALILGVAVFLLLPDGPQDARWLTAQERSTIQAHLAEESRSHAGAIHDVKRALADSRVLLLCAIYFGIIVGFYGISFWLPQIVQAMGFSVSETGWIVAVPYAVTGVAMLAWGHHSDVTGDRIWHVALASLFAAFGFAASTMLNSPLVVLIALTLAAVGILSAVAPFWALPSQFLSGVGAAAGIALINAVGNLGGFLGPYVVGWALQQTGGYSGGMAVLAASMTIAAALVLAMGQFKPLRSPA